MGIKVIDLMSKEVITARPHFTVGNVKERMVAKSIKCIPIVGEEEEVLGIVSLTDIVSSENEETPVTEIMSEKVYTIPEYEDVQIAARIMRNHKIHHIVVTKDKCAIGMISSFDLLKLVEGKRFEIKNQGTQKKKGSGKRSQQEQSLS